MIDSLPVTDRGGQLRCTITRRNARAITVVSDATGQTTTLLDRSGDLELLLQLLAEGRSREDAVAVMTAHRDGIHPEALRAALRGLERMGLLDPIAGP